MPTPKEGMQGQRTDGGNRTMDPKEELLHQRVEGIIAELSNYFEIRYAQMTRIKPGLHSMYADLLLMEMEKVREIMVGEKMFGPIRIRVGDILGSRDEAKRHAVMGPIDQASILNELIPEQEEAGVRRPGFLSVRNMQAFYTSVDSSLGPVLELVDIWLWWDVLDAADAFNFKEAKKLLEKRRGEEVTQAMERFYHAAMGRRDERTVTREEILTFEFVYLESIWKNFMQRRAEEKSFMMVIKRDPIGGQDSVDDLIVTLSRHISARQKLSQEGGLDDRLRDYYAKMFKCDPSHVKAEQAIAHEDLTILQLRGDLKTGLERGAVLGPPYDFKKSQGEQMRGDLEQYRRTLPLVKSLLAEVAKPVAAKPAAAAAAAAGAADDAGGPKPVETRAAAPQPAPKEEPVEESPLLF